MAGEADEAALEHAADEVYAAPADDFMRRRSELAAAAKAGGDAATAKAITALRKPTLAAAVVNRYALAEPAAVTRLVGLGDELRRAQRDLDATLMRELSTQRRTVVGEIVRDALAHDGRDGATTSLRDEVTATFDAAVADPDVAARLGRLLRPESFSGFGVAPGPALSVVEGGRSTRVPPSRSTSASKSASKSTRTRTATTSEPTPAAEQADTDAVPSATARRLARRADTARGEFEAAAERLTAAEDAERRSTARVQELTGELAELQRDLDDAKRALETARREARSALDRAERAQQRGEENG